MEVDDSKSDEASVGSSSSHVVVVQDQGQAVDQLKPEAPSSYTANNSMATDTPNAIVEVILDLKYKWSGNTYDISVAETDTVGDLKALVFSQTTIPVERQKILNLCKGKLPEDDTVLAHLNLQDRPKKEFNVLGTPLGREVKASLDLGPQESLDEKDVESTTSLKLDDPALKQRNARKLLECVNKLELNIMNPPRKGKKLLVLDLDYTILVNHPEIDCIILKLTLVLFQDTHAWKSQNFHAIDYMRPGMHDFLEAVYPHYDIVIWSQTSWMWLESKLIELGMVGDESKKYKISFVLDRGPMFSVYSMRHGKPFKHEVKALEIIWRKFPEYYSAANSIHIDDLSRNFALNPQQGLKISAYKDASKARQTDRELPDLAEYLIAISALDTLETLDHAKWKKYITRVQQ